MTENSIEEMSSFFNGRAKTYDYHMLDEMGLKVFYDEMENCYPVGKRNVKVLDLGCGTGLEIERVFKVYPDAQVTGVDLSANMLEVLKSKFSDRESQLNLICKSYFDIDFENEIYDLVISTYSLHHFEAELKLTLYNKIFSAMKQGGLYIEGDLMVKSKEEEIRRRAECERICKTEGATQGFYHYDTPLAIETQINLFKKAGFGNITLHKEWDNTCIIICCKN